jgi:hypothetical protein
MKTNITFALGLLPAWALAHPGHGLTAPHWHASDLWGYVLLAGVAAASAWFARRK